MLHRSPVPVLIARRLPGDEDFPHRIPLALDAGAPSREATRITARLAARHGSAVTIFADRPSNAAQSTALAEQAATILDHTDQEPLILDEHAAPHKAVTDAPADVGASLVVTGSRGLAGVRAVRSVSERVAHAAPCSVLVVRPASG